VNWRLRSFKVINFCCNRKPIYDFPLVINCHLTSYLAPFPRYTPVASRIRKPLNTWLRRPPSNFIIKLGTWQAKSWGSELHCSENYMILSLTILSQYTHVTDRRQRSDYNANCNVQLIMCQYLVSLPACLPSKPGVTVTVLQSHKHQLTKMPPRKHQRHYKCKIPKFSGEALRECQTLPAVTTPTPSTILSQYTRVTDRRQ